MFFTKPTRQDKLNSVIARYSGNLSDKQMKFLRDHFSHYDGSVQDREYKVLGELGYVGSLNDRWNAYMQDLGGTGLESLEVLYKTFYGAAGYHENDKDPEFVIDTLNDFYRKKGEGTKGALQPATGFSQVVEHSRNGNATMTDSDGLLKWAPHNLLTYSEDLSNSDWGKTNTTVTANAAVAPDGTTTADEISHTSTTGEIFQNVFNVLTDGEEYSVGVYVKYVDHQWFRIYHENGSTYFDILNGTTGTVGANSASITDVGNGWYFCHITNTHNSADSSVLTVFLLADANGSGTETVGTSAYIWGAHLYRSDLGGMADVPADDRVIPSATTYVRTAGRVIGSELVTNGTFDTGDLTGFTDGSIGTGAVDTSTNAAVITSTDGSNYGKFTWTGSGMSSEVYQITFTVSGPNNAYFSSGGWLSSLNADYTAGTHTVFAIANSATPSLSFQVTGNSGTTTIDNISVKEIDVDPSSARYLPRRGHHVYNGSQWVNEGLLHESEARTNLVTQSGDMADAIWLVQGGSWGVASSDGWQEFTGDGASSKHRNYDDTADLSDGSNYTLSVDLEYVDYQWAYLAIYDGFTTFRNWFDLQNGVKGTTGGSVVGHTMDQIGPNQYRCSITITTGVSASAGNIQIGLASADGSYGTFATSGKYKARHPQFEAGSTPSSYIPTSGSTVTRAAETLTIPAANLPWPSPVYVTNEELVTNGTFDGDTDWTLDTGWEISSGKLRSISAVNATKAYQILATTVGSVYEATILVDSVSGTFPFQARDVNQAGAVLGYADLTTGVNVFYFTANSASTAINIDDYGSSLVADNISVKEINPLGLSIQMDGRMTYADTSLGTDVKFWDWREDSNNLILSYLYAAGATTGQFILEQRLNGTADYAVGSATAYAPGVNVPFNTASRHTSLAVQEAADGITTPEETATVIGLPDLENTDLSLGEAFMGTIGTFRVWAEDIGDTGLEEATEPSEEATLFLSFDGTETSYVSFDWSE